MRFARYLDQSATVRVGVLGDSVVHAIDGVSDIVALFDANAETLRQAGNTARGTRLPRTLGAANGP